MCSGLPTDEIRLRDLARAFPTDEAKRNQLDSRCHRTRRQWVEDFHISIHKPRRLKRKPAALFLVLTRWKKYIPPYPRPIDLSAPPYDLLLLYVSVLLSSMTVTVEASDHHKLDFVSCKIAYMWPGI